MTSEQRDARIAELKEKFGVSHKTDKELLDDFFHHGKMPGDD